MAYAALSERLEYYDPDDSDLVPFLLRRGARIIHEREGGLVECYVPVESIDHEEVAVRQEWAESLAAQMCEYASLKGGTGQKQTIGLGMIPTESRLKIVDGFHRDAALRINGALEVYASAQQTNWDELYDDRIILAKDHTQVRFSRVVEWMRECWQYSGFPDQMSITQALLLYRMQTSGKRLEVDPEVVRATSDWVSRKEAKWGIAAMTMRNYLMIAEHVDPILVHATREKDRGDMLTAPTQKIVELFCEILPDNFDLQNLVMDIAMKRNLKGPEVRTVCLAVKDKTYGEATEAVNDINWDEMEVVYEETTARRRRRAHDPRYKGALALSKSADEITGVIERTELIKERNEVVDDGMKTRLIEARRRAEDLIAELGKLSTSLTDLINDGQVSSAENVLEARRRAHLDAAAKTEKVPQVPSNSEVLSIPARPTLQVVPELSPVLTDKQIESMSGRVRGLVSYLMGDSDQLPNEYSRHDLHQAWGIVSSTADRIKGWPARFKNAQPRHESIRRSERVERGL